MDEIAELERWATVLTNPLSRTGPDVVPLSSMEADELAALLRVAARRLNR